MSLMGTLAKVAIGVVLAKGVAALTAGDGWLNLTGRAGVFRTPDGAVLACAVQAGEMWP